jgi:hypothetical protein
MPKKKSQSSRAVRRKVSNKKVFRQQCVQWFLKGEHARIALPPDVLLLVEQLRRRLADLGIDVPQPGKKDEIAQGVDFLIWLGFAMQANAIHIEPSKAGVHVHMHLWRQPHGARRRGTQYDMLTSSPG